MKKFICRISLWMILCLVSITKSVTAEDTQINKSVSTNQVSIEIKNSSYKKQQSMKSIIYDVELELTNHSEEELMEIKTELLFFDKNDCEVFSSVHVFNGQNTPVLPGESVPFLIGARAEYPEKPAYVEATILEVYTAKEKPPIDIPEKGEFLYQAYPEEHLNMLPEEMPVSVSLWIDKMGDRQEAEITEKEDILKLMDAFMRIKIGTESMVEVSDNYNGMMFTYEDGEQVTIRLNLRNLEYPVYYGTRIYELEEFEEFWELMKEYTHLS